MASSITPSASSLAVTAACGGIIIVSAGRWDLPFVWVMLGFIWLNSYLSSMMSEGPTLTETGKAPIPGNGDRLMNLLGGVFLIGHWILAGLDVGRFHWSQVPWPAQIAGVCGYAAALVFTLWAMRVNRFYFPMAESQKDCGNRVVQVGPYGWVRHPGYLASLIAMFSGGIALGSWLALIPLIGFAALFLIRTIMEDRLMHTELPNYADYAKRVRWRLLPGVI
jgi:protein-S-isoprenylcysteine O-methyltransferase Ste14